MAYREERLQRQLLGVHAGGARPADDAAGERVGDERRVAEASARHAHVGGVGDMQPVRCVFCQIFVGRFGVSFSPFERLFLGRFGFGQSCGLSVIA